MTNASMSFKKRNRSTSTSTHTDPSKILASKLNKLRSTSLALFSRLTNSVNTSSTAPRSSDLRRERSFSFATSGTDHRNMDTLVRDPRLLDRVSRYRSSQAAVKSNASECSIEEHNILTVSNDPSDKKRYDTVIQSQWRRARDGNASTDRLQVPMSTPHFTFQKTGLSMDPDMTVKSEELTAREFADMTGIKIISDDEHDDSYSSDVMVSHAIDRVETKGSVLTADVLHQSSITATSSIHSAETHAWSIKCKPQIWDSGFWQKPDCCTAQCQPCQQPIPIHVIPQKIDDKPRPQTTATSSEDTTSTMLSNLFSCNTASSCGSSIDSELLSSSPRTHDDEIVAEPPLISQLRRTSCTSAIKRNEQSGGVIIKKGRFHICLGDTQDTHIPSLADEECIEWKRKSMITIG